jgi:hypothetical protein
MTAAREMQNLTLQRELLVTYPGFLSGYANMFPILRETLSGFNHVVALPPVTPAAIHGKALWTCLTALHCLENIAHIFAKPFKLKNYTHFKFRLKSTYSYKYWCKSRTKSLTEPCANIQILWQSFYLTLKILL